MKLDGVAPLALLADLANFTTDTDTDPLSYGQLNIWTYRQKKILHH